MKLAFIAKHRTVWPVAWMCTALSVSRSGFHAWLTRPPSQRAREDEAILVKTRASFVASDRTYGKARLARFARRGCLVRAAPRRADHARERLAGTAAPTRAAEGRG